MKTSIDDPWIELPVPASDGEITGRRVDSDGRYDFFWARDAEGRPLLVLNHSGMDVSVPLPDLNGLEVFRAPGKPGSRPMILWRLSQREHAEIFRELCLDVIRAAEGCAAEQAAVETSIGRTWRWHHLLRGGGRGRLTLPQQLGLFAELLVLRVILAQTLPPLAALRTWKGPLGEAKDFLWANTAIEVKAVTRNSGGAIQINSEFQLDSSQHHALWLVVTTLADGENDTTKEARTLDALIEESLAGIFGDPESHSLLVSLLAAAGYDPTDGYNDHVWRLVRLDCYRVEGHFPRLVPHTVPLGVTNIRYSLTLDQCASHLQDRSVLLSTLTNPGDD